MLTLNITLQRPNGREANPIEAVGRLVPRLDEVRDFRIVTNEEDERVLVLALDYLESIRPEDLQTDLDCVRLAVHGDGYETGAVFGPDAAHNAFQDDEFYLPDGRTLRAWRDEACRMSELLSGNHTFTPVRRRVVVPNVF
jgi:hypothetical protein